MNKKTCNFDCLYCQLGSKHTRSKTAIKDWPTATQILKEWRSFFRKNVSPIHALVLSGNGEPTLNPHFDKIAAALRHEQTQSFPHLRLVLFSNGTLWHKPRIWQSLVHFDEIALKWDADSNIANKPIGKTRLSVPLEKLAKLPNLVLQCCFFDGPKGNAKPKAIKNWEREVLTIQPRRIDLYTATRPPADPVVRAVTPSKLMNVQRRLEARGYSSVAIAM